MNVSKLENIEQLINGKKIDQAQMELSKLGPEFLKNTQYLYLRSKIFYFNKLYYLALDTLLISLEFGENEKIYSLISKIYKTLGNLELSKKVANPNLRINAITTLKNELTGISQKGYEI
tara:strand:- start:74 stop:430 length:357 start_codon:yes stop_codon:yes gene_type:complete